MRECLLTSYLFTVFRTGVFPYLALLKISLSLDFQLTALRQISKSLILSNLNVQFA